MLTDQCVHSSTIIIIQIVNLRNSVCEINNIIKTKISIATDAWPHTTARQFCFSLNFSKVSSSSVTNKIQYLSPWRRKASSRNSLFSDAKRPRDVRVKTRPTTKLTNWRICNTVVHSGCCFQKKTFNSAPVCMMNELSIDCWNTTCNIKLTAHAQSSRKLL